MPNSELSTTLNVSKDQWVLSLVAILRQKLRHSVLVLETMEADEKNPVIYEADLVTTIGKTTTDKKLAKIQLVKKKKEDLKTYVQVQDAKFCSWQISSAQGERFLDQVQAEAKKKMMYLEPSQNLTWKEVSTCLDATSSSYSFSVVSSSTVYGQQQNAHHSLSWALFLLNIRNLTCNSGRSCFKENDLLCEKNGDVVDEVQRICFEEEQKSEKDQTKDQMKIIAPSTSSAKISEEKTPSASTFFSSASLTTQSTGNFLSSSLSSVSTAKSVPAAKSASTVVHFPSTS